MDKFKPKSQNKKKFAYQIIAAAIRNKMIPKAKELDCVDCENLAARYHHEDYAYPLDIIPLCEKCHSIRHASPKTIQVISTPLVFKNKYHRNSVKQIRKEFRDGHSYNDLAEKYGVSATTVYRVFLYGHHSLKLQEGMGLKPKERPRLTVELPRAEIAEFDQMRCVYGLSRKEMFRKMSRLSAWLTKIHLKQNPIGE